MNVPIALLRNVLHIQGEIVEVYQNAENRHTGRSFVIVIEGPEGMPVPEGGSAPFIAGRLP